MGQTLHPVETCNLVGVPGTTIYPKVYGEGKLTILIYLFGEFPSKKTHLTKETVCRRAGADAGRFMLSSSLRGQEMMLRWVLFALFLGICASAGEQKKKMVKPQSLARGWGNSISWVHSYKDGLSKMVKSQKPLMVIHHLEHCPHSKDPSKTVRTDIRGKYSNHAYTYDPSDMAQCLGQGGRSGGFRNPLVP
ncbi:hypothetical protein L3Q82_004443 [Scortum barcoo]|uniref:Uncharacterized protein n=1 Tax=Scortum barcoo TaxID=214431 RepID=A0ACB8VJU2_9TELE|nr:hypothetical protein L3Q82_004443 [Scortum barcoo]